MPCLPKAASCACACMRSSERLRRARRGLALLALLISPAAWHPPARAEAPLPDDAVKAAVIYKVMLFTHWPGEGGSSRVCSGFQGRKVLGLLMTHSHAQIHCCHWDLGRFMGVCGEALGGLCATGS